MSRLTSFIRPILLSGLALFIYSTATTMAQQVPADKATLPESPAEQIVTDPAAIAQAETFLDIMMKGGAMVMIPLAILSFIAVLLIIFYIFTIRQGSVVSDKFMNAADALIRKQDYLGLIAVCNRENECIARIVHKTLDFATKNPTASFEEVREVTEAEGSRQASILNQRIIYLADIGRIAPMVGLLGTVIGMIKAFDSIGSGVQQMELAPGVSQALITTASGLVQKLIAEMEAASTHIMALLAAQYKRANYRASARRSERDAEAPELGGSHEPRSL